MDQVLASSLSGYSVMTTTGAELGVLSNVTADLQTGELEYFRIDPNGNNTGGFQETDAGHILVPADAVSEKSDYLLVEPASE
ncbi:PRC-barrel domain-containing protein [Halorubrum distributum]|uniref:PRC-barrel domain-containing protein n=1 Tax=Halorubrum distributum TaxID=29283 RepID=UPI002952D0AB|nr:PRC-barrel domain-containing protein [Halorubrum distributum]MDV7351082.1 PRC-barrel domain-containing protein [Halorubrum distributum]